MIGGEIYVKKIPSMKVVDIAQAVSPNAQIQIVGVRPGEKLHEQMIGVEDAPYTYEYDQHFKILPAIHGWDLDPKRIDNGRRVSSDFTYVSDTNKEWMSVESLREWVTANERKIGKI